jgi:hypothetical protein
MQLEAKRSDAHFSGGGSTFLMADNRKPHTLYTAICIAKPQNEGCRAAKRLKITHSSGFTEHAQTAMCDWKQ